ncbi:MAG: hypothetical protein DCC88_02965 [Spirobacillus cienkowskii]|jgi:hypothetical protein|uniref:Uncharacterized protein n=1 Tax=Spirobacillus cienkowskii TaxID=495820 RepID=A0A369KQA5_9BACT|nr:MAG: hypothetical protein DCC88_02965 [Spirobacillus cienkowskii]
MTIEKVTKNQIQDKDFVSSDKDKTIGRCNIFSLFLGGIAIVAVATVFNARANDILQFDRDMNSSRNGMTVRHENQPFVKEIRRAESVLVKLMNEKNEENKFHIQQKKFADYISEQMSQTAKMQSENIAWYPEPFTQEMKDIASHYDNIYNKWTPLQRTNKQLSPQERLFVAGANQHLQGAYHKVKSSVYKEIFNNIQNKVIKDKAEKKIPDYISESDAIRALSQKLLVQMQLSQYAATTELLNSINILILSKNPSAFHIPENMKLPTTEDFTKIINAATSEEIYSVKYSVKTDEKLIKVTNQK